MARKSFLLLAAASLLLFASLASAAPKPPPPKKKPPPPVKLAAKPPPPKAAPKSPPPAKSPPPPPPAKSPPPPKKSPPPPPSPPPPAASGPKNYTSITGANFKNLRALAASFDGTKAFGLAQDASSNTIAMLATIGTTAGASKVSKTYTDGKNVDINSFVALNGDGSVVYMSAVDGVHSYRTTAAALGSALNDFYRVADPYNYDGGDPFSTPIALFFTPGGQFWVAGYALYGFDQDGNFMQSLQVNIYRASDDSLFANITVANSQPIGTVPSFAVSPDARYIGVASSNSGINVQAINADGTPGAFINLAPVGKYWQMGFSPDSKVFGFVSDQRLIATNLTTLFANKGGLSRTNLLNQTMTAVTTTSSVKGHRKLLQDDTGGFPIPTPGDFLPWIAFSADSKYVHYINTWATNANYRAGCFQLGSLSSPQQQVLWKNNNGPFYPWSPQFPAGGVLAGNQILADNLASTQVWSLNA